MEHNVRSLTFRAPMWVVKYGGYCLIPYSVYIFLIISFLKEQIMSLCRYAHYPLQIEPCVHEYPCDSNCLLARCHKGLTKFRKCVS